jgi:hypothetical protein
MLFPLTLKILGLQHFNGTDHCELENHRRGIYIYIYIYIYMSVPLFYSTFNLSLWKWVDSVAGIETCYGLDDWKFDPQWGVDFLFARSRPERPWSRLRLPHCVWQGVLLTSDPQQALGLGQSTDIFLLPLCAFMAWYRENFTFRVETDLFLTQYIPLQWYLHLAVVDGLVSSSNRES